MSTFLAAAAAACQTGTQGPAGPTPSPSPTPCSIPLDIANDWDSFYDAWVEPVVHFGVPALVLFAVFVALSVIATPLLVGKNEPGIRSGGDWARWILLGMYCYGVLCLAYAAIEVTVVYPVQRYVYAKVWVTVVAIALSVFAVAITIILFWVFDRARPAPGGTIFFGALACVTGAVCLAVNYQKEGLDWRYNVVIYAPILAVTGIMIAGRARGIGIGMLIKGHDKSGSDDAGLGAFVQARLYSLGSGRPSGFLITQQTDVTTLPSDALSLIPSGTLAKLAALVVSWFSPATPWRIDITEQFDQSIIVSMRRNGVMAESTVIRPSTLSLPAQESQGADTQPSAPASGTSGVSSTGGTMAQDWTAELRTAAAAYILVELSKRYDHLKPGLSGATQWRSVAQQVIATDSTSQLDQEERRSLLVRATASDCRNQAAELALLSTEYRTAASVSDHRDAADKFSNLLKKVQPQSGGGRRVVSPLELRLRFNLLAASGNYAAALPQNGDAEDARKYLECAKSQAQFLLTCKDNEILSDGTVALWENMYSAVQYAALAIKKEWNRWNREPVVICGQEDELPADENVSLLGRYEYACAFIPRPRLAVPAAKGDYDKALDALALAVVEPSQRIWARTDPWLTALHDVDAVARSLAVRVNGSNLEGADSDAANAYKIAARFKGMIGDPAPADFLALPPLTAHRDALGQLGIHNAHQLSRVKSSELVRELGITAGEAARWRNLTELHQRLAAAAPPHGQTEDRDQRATQLVFLLLILNLDSLATMRQALTDSQLKGVLLATARPWAIVAPGSDEITHLEEAIRRG